MKAAALICAALVAAAVVYRRERLSWPLRWLAVFACLALVAIGSGLIQLPDFETVIRRAASALGPYMYVLVGVLAFLETGGGVGLVAPGEFVVVLGGVSAGQGEIELIPLIAIVWVCALAGDLTSFVLGRRLGTPFLIRRGHVVGITPQRLHQVERFFAGHGGKTIILGRFISLVRSLSPFIAGASRMPARRFIPYTTIASGVWAVTFCVLGYVFWHSLDDVVAVTKQGTMGLVAAIAVVVASIALYRRRRAQDLGEPNHPAPVAAEQPDPTW
jgi:undecaprenyl-diphosphatase